MKLYLALFALFLSHLACGGTNNLPVETGPIIHLSHVNKFQTALSGDLVPRDTSGNVGDITANDGQQTNRWAQVWTKGIALQKDQPGNPINFAAPTMASPYTLTFPATLPASNLPLWLNNSGTLSTGTITTAAIGSAVVTPDKLSAKNIVISSSAGTSFSYSGAQGDVNNLSVSITTTGRPVFIGLISDGDSSSPSYIATGTGGAQNLYILRDGTGIQVNNISWTGGGNTPTGSIWTVDAAPSATTHTYKLQANGAFTFVRVRLCAYEL